MKKLKLFIVILIGLTTISCEVKNDSSYIIHIQEDCRIITIENCQYLYYHNRFNYGEGVFTHKGNCINPIHCYNEQ